MILRLHDYPSHEDAVSAVIANYISKHALTSFNFGAQPPETIKPSSTCVDLTEAGMLVMHQLPVVPQALNLKIGMWVKATATCVIAGVGDLDWREATARAGGPNNPNRLWPVAVRGFDELLKRKNAQVLPLLV